MSESQQKLFVLICAVICVVFALACGGGGGGGGGGSSSTTTTTSVAMGGTVSYPSVTTAKPGMLDGRRTSRKVDVSSTSLLPVSGAEIGVYTLSDSDFSDPITTGTTSSTGVFQILTSRLGEYSDDPVIFRATWTGSNGKKYGIRKLIDLGDSDTSTSEIDVDPLTESIIQKVVDVLTGFGLTLSPTQFSALASMVENITSQTETDLADGLTFSFDEDDMLAANTADFTYSGAAGDLTGTIGTTIGGLITNGEMALVENGAGTSAVKKAKFIDFLNLIGFPVATSDHTQCYVSLEDRFFLENSGSYITASDLTGIDPAGAGYSRQTYLVSPATVFVDADTDGVVDYDTVFSQERKDHLMEVMIEDLPCLSDSLITALVENFGTDLTVSDIASAIAENFTWAREDVITGPDGQPVFLDEVVDLTETEGGTSISASKVLSNLLIVIPPTPLELANQIAAKDHVIFDIADEAINQAIYEGFEADPNFDPDTIFSQFTNEEAVKNWVMTSSVWLRVRDRIRQALYAGISPSLYGTALTADTQVSIPAAFLLIKMIVDRPYLINPLQGYTRTVTEGAETWIEPRWGNIKFMTTGETPMKGIIQSLVGTSFTTSDGLFEDTTFITALETLDSSMEVNPDWTEGQVKTITFDPAATATVYGQILRINESTGAEEASASLDIHLYLEADAGLGTPLHTATTSTYGVYSFTGLSLDTDYAVVMDAPSGDQFFDYFRTERYGGRHTDADSDGDIDTVEIRLGWMRGDPQPGSETASDWQWSGPLLLEPQGGFAVFPSVGLLPDDTADFSAAGTTDFLNNSTTPDVAWSYSNNLLSAGTASTTLTDIAESSLGLTGGLADANFVGGTGSLTSISAYASGGTSGSSVTPSVSSYDASGNYQASLYLVQSGESQDFDLDGTTETYAWLLEVAELTSDGMLVMDYAIVDSSGRVMLPPDPYAETIAMADYYPINAGDEYVYVERNKFNNVAWDNSLKTFRVIGPASLPNSVNTTEWREYGPVVVDPALYDSAFFEHYDPNGNLVSAGDQDEDVSTTYYLPSPPIVRAYPQNKIGQRIEFNITSEQWEAGSITDTLASTGELEFTGLEDVTVLAGTFEDCLVVRSYRQDTEGWNIEVNHLASGIGTVKKESWSSDGEHLVSLLVHATVDGTSTGTDPDTLPVGRIQTINANGTPRAHFKVHARAATGVAMTGPDLGGAFTLTNDGDGVFTGNTNLAGVPEAGDVYTITAALSGGGTATGYCKVPNAILVNPTVITPTDGQSFATTTPTFEWDDVTAAIDFASWVHVQVYTAGPTLVWESDWEEEELRIPATDTQVTVGTPLAPGSYTFILWVHDRYDQQTGTSVSFTVL